MCMYMYLFLVCVCVCILCVCVRTLQACVYALAEVDRHRDQRSQSRFDAYGPVLSSVRRLNNDLHYIVAILTVRCTLHTV